MGSRVAYVAVSAAAGLGLAVPAALATPGAVVYRGCAGAQPGCSPVLPGTLNQPVAVAVSSDGRQLYATAMPTGQGSGVVDHFSIDQNGNLTFVNCFGDLSSCNPVTSGALNTANGVALSPDGANLYVTSADAVSHFTVGSAGT